MSNLVKFEVGDLVQFDITHLIGLVTATKKAAAFGPHENIVDVKVLWVDGEEFWCLGFTLKLISKIK